jgi:hypothetical protein
MFLKLFLAKNEYAKNNPRKLVGFLGYLGFFDERLGFKLVFLPGYGNLPFVDSFLFKILFYLHK